MNEFKLAFNLDDEFRQRNRPLTKQESLGLARLIEEEQCADGALVVAIIGTEKILCDGYNTLAICQEKGIVPSEPRYLAFKDRQEVLEWIDRHQRGRRNLTPEQMAQNRAERIERVVQAAAAGTPIKEIAKEEGVAPKTIRRDIDDFEGRPPPPLQITDSQESPQEKPKLICRPCRMRSGGPKPGCKDCASLQNPKTPPTPKPPKEHPELAAEPTTCPTCNGTGLVTARKGSFAIPTVAQVQAYCDQRNNGIDAEQFVAFYTSKGWKIGSSPMKDWRSAVITWEKNTKARDNGKSTHAEAHKGMKAFLEKGDE